MKLLRNLSITILILGLIAFIAYRGLNTLEKEKKEEAERNEKLANGTCVFNTLPLDHLLIEGFAKPLKFKMSRDSMKYVDPEERDISYAPFEGSVYAANVNITHMGPLKFLLGKDVVVDPSWSLKDFSKRYPLSYACRDQSGGQLALNTWLYIENSIAGSPIQAINFHFNAAEKVQSFSVDFRPGYEIETDSVAFTN